MEFSSWELSEIQEFISPCFITKLPKQPPKIEFFVEGVIEIIGSFSIPYELMEEDGKVEFVFNQVPHIVPSSHILTPMFSFMSGNVTCTMAKKPKCSKDELFGCLVKIVHKQCCLSFQKFPKDELMEYWFYERIKSIIFYLLLSAI